MSENPIPIADHTHIQIRPGDPPSGGEIYIYTNRLETITLHVNIAGEVKLYRRNDYKGAFTEVSE